METTGLFESNVDAWLGMPSLELNAISIRKRRNLVIRRVEELLLEDAR